MNAAAITPELLHLAAMSIRAKHNISVDPPPDNWRGWLGALFPRYTERAFADFHADFWDWVWALRDGETAAPFVGVWSRGFGKSTSTELAVASVAARGSRRYALYVCETQNQADTHVKNVASALGSKGFAAAYRQVGARRMNKYGASDGWRRNRLITASGFVLDAIGLDTAARGAKVDEDRPDLLIFDDIDGTHDSAGVIEKKIRTLTQDLLPAGAAHATVLAVQNLVSKDGVFGRLVDGRADFMIGRTVSGPHPAIANLTWEWQDGRAVITGGEPTWPALGIEACQSIIDRMGITAFLVECQHEVDQVKGGMFDHLDYQRCDWSEVPDLVMIVVWVDPAVTDTDSSDSHGIQADGIASDGKIYRLYSWEDRTTPQDVLLRGLRKAIELGAICVGVETDNGGDTWESVYDQAVEVLRKEYLEREETSPRFPEFRSNKASKGYGSKVERASKMLTEYERAQIIHVRGTHGVLERALNRFPKKKPFDLVDASYWSWNDLTDNAVQVAPVIGGAMTSTWGAMR